MDTYKLFRKDKGKRGSGLVLYVKECVNCLNRIKRWMRCSINGWQKLCY